MSAPFWEPLAASPQQPPIVTVGTTLPASPTDTQEAILVDSLTNPTYAWHFKYMASITGANKWVFLGGAPHYTFPGTANQTIAAVSAWTYPATTCDFVAPRSGDYLLTGGSIMSLPSGGPGTMYVGIANASLGPTPIGPYFGNTPATFGQQVSMSVLSKLSLVAGQTARLVHYSPVAGTNVIMPYLSAIPVRCS